MLHCLHFHDRSTARPSADAADALRSGVRTRHAPSTAGPPARAAASPVAVSLLLVEDPFRFFLRHTSLFLIIHRLNIK